MKYRVLIRNNKENDSVYTEWFESEGDKGVIDFLWTEGNCACDCNLGDFYRNAKGLTEENTKCGQGAFCPVHIEFDDGTKIEID